jgi:hypothetical protein
MSMKLSADGLPGMMSGHSQGQSNCWKCQNIQAPAHVHEGDVQTEKQTYSIIDVVA